MRFLLLLAALWASGAAAADSGADLGAPVTAVPAGPLKLFVELVINGQAGGALAEMTQDGGRLLVEAEALRSAGIGVSGDGGIDVARMTGVRATYDAAGQRLLLDVPPALLPTRRIAAARAPEAAPVIDAGALFNYDLYVQSAGGRTGATLWTEQRGFGRFGTVSNTGIVRVGDGRRTGYVRFDTSYRWTGEARALELTAGDLITRALPWSTSVRIGGVQLSRSFALRPDLITAPLPSFAGESAVPTGVDLFVNGYHQSRAEVAPGRFVLDAVPVVNGAGEARIVTTNAVGRQIATVIPFYVAPDLLRPGLTDFSVEAGMLRRNYGRTSFDYRRAVASASVRRGATERLTLSGHAEATRWMAGAGVGVGWAPGLWGVLSGAVAVSRDRDRTGRQVTAGYSYQGRRISFGAEHVERSRGFTDLGSFDLGRLGGSVRSDRVSMSLPIDGVGSLGAGFIAARAQDGARARIASASLSLPVGRRASAFIATDYDLARRTVSAQLRLILPFGGSRVASAGVSREPAGDLRHQAGLAQPAPTEGGLGYAVDLGLGGGRVVGQATALWRSEVVQVEAGAAVAGGARSLWGGATGSVALLDGRAFLANALPGAFALVATGMPRVPVFYENQKMGETDGGGRLFVPNVTARHAGRFAIDPVVLPLGAVAERTEARAALRAGTGAIIRLPVNLQRSAVMRVVDAAGQSLPPGTIATLAGGRTTTVGWDGVLAIDGTHERVEILARAGDAVCRASVVIAAGEEPFVDLGVIECR